MNTLIQVWIGIQARSTSTRFPNKVSEDLNGKPVLRHVIDQCDKAAFYLNRYTAKSMTQVSYAVLIPFRDPIKEVFNTRAIILEGPEDDVLGRYRILSEKMRPNYIVRITSDCPLVPYALISKAIKISVTNEYDYCSNVDPRFRLAIDGHDVEVLSRRALEWADTNAVSSYEREHVTPILQGPTVPTDFKIGAIMGPVNTNGVKQSIDTVEDLNFVRKHHAEMESKIRLAREILGKNHVHIY